MSTGGFARPFDCILWMLSSSAPDQPEAGPLPVPVTCAEDLELVRRLQARDRKAIACFITAHADAIHGFVRFRLAPRAERADDVVQDVFLAAWQKLGA